MTRESIEKKLIRMPEENATLVKDDSVIATLIHLNAEGMLFSNILTNILTSNTIAKP